MKSGKRVAADADFDQQVAVSLARMEAQKRQEQREREAQVDAENEACAGQWLQVMFLVVAVSFVGMLTALLHECMVPVVRWSTGLFFITLMMMVPTCWLYAGIRF